MESIISFGQNYAWLFAIPLAVIAFAHIPGVKEDIPVFLKFLQSPLLIVFCLGLGILNAISVGVSLFPFLTGEEVSGDAGLEIIYYSVFVFLPLSGGLIGSSTFISWTRKGLLRVLGIIGLCVGIALFIYWIALLFLFQ